MNIFEQASRRKYRFSTAQGLLSADDLWDLPLTSTRHVNLNSIAIDLHKQIKDSAEVSFVETKSVTDTDLETKFEIVKYIIEDKKSVIARNNEAATTKEHNARIDSLIASKKDAALAEMSVEDLEKLRK